jgi:hypothetical protein
MNWEMMVQEHVLDLQCYRNLLRESAVSKAAYDKGTIICQSRVSCTISFIRNLDILQYYEG